MNIQELQTHLLEHGFAQAKETVRTAEGVHFLCCIKANGIDVKAAGVLPHEEDLTPYAIELWGCVIMLIAQFYGYGTA